MKKNDVSSFFYYMWNTWCKEECKATFINSNCPWQHFWAKYCDYYDKFGSDGAISVFFASINEEYQDLLVERATKMYDRKIRKQIVL